LDECVDAGLVGIRVAVPPILSFGEGVGYDVTRAVALYSRLRRGGRKLKHAEPDVLFSSRLRRGGRKLKQAEPDVLLLRPARLNQY